ncbi:MAG: hypothetical protein LC677_11070 [Halomonas sp.]|nr:hypothetical protein [Halomonas sp.]
MTSLTNQHPSRDAKIKPLGELAERLSREMAGEVLFDRATRGRYSTDASIYQVTPVGVVIPRHQQDLKVALDIARDAKVPILARGAGTSQCGQTAIIPADRVRSTTAIWCTTYWAWKHYWLTAARRVLVSLIASRKALKSSALLNR